MQPKVLAYKYNSLDEKLDEDKVTNQMTDEEVQVTLHTCLFSESYDSFLTLEDYHAQYQNHIVPNEQIEEWETQVERVDDMGDVGV